MLRRALKDLGSDAEGGTFIDSWHLTDKSSSSFDSIKEEFSAQNSYLDMRFDELDIERDPAAQGFETESYDLVLAVQTMHETQNLAAAMMNVRKLLKPGASLLLVETTQVQIDQKLAFGLLPALWNCEDLQRKEAPYLTVPMWQSLLSKAGFNGIEAKLRDYETDDDVHAISTIVTSIPALPLQLPQDGVVIVASGKHAPPDAWIESLRRLIADITGVLPAFEMIELVVASSVKDKACIFLGEADQPLLQNLDNMTMQGIKTIMSNSKSMLWVTRGAAAGCENPDMALASGFLRVLRSELGSHNLVSLDLDPSQPAWTESNASTIVHMLRYEVAEDQDASNAVKENEFALRNGRALVPRFVKDPERHAMFSTREPDWTVPESLPQLPFSQAGSALRLEVGVPGQLESLAFDVDESYSDALGINDVEIEPRAYGLNTRDGWSVMD